MDVWIWEMEMCCGMEMEALRKEMDAYSGRELAPGTKIDSGMTACPHDEMLFEAVRFWINVLENGRMEVMGRVFYWHAADGGWHKTATLRTFETFDDCLKWLDNKDSAGSEESASILKNLGR